MTLTITVDGTDITDKVRIEDLTLEMTAVQGQVGTGTLYIDDTSGVADLAPITSEWSVTESTATPTTIAGGFVGETRVDKGPLRAGGQRQFVPVLEDWNTCLTDRSLRGSSTQRPQESDYKRISWLFGMPQMNMLDGAGQVPNSNTVTMPATNYWGKKPLDVLDDCAEAAGKNFYIYYEDGTGWVPFYDTVDSTDAAFTSSVSISDDISEIDNSTIFGASAIDWQVDPDRIYSSLLVKYTGGVAMVTNSATESAYRKLHRTVVKENYTSGSAARSWATRQLAKLNEPTKRLSLTVSVPGSVLGELRAGYRIPVKLRSRGITAFTYFRIASVTIQPRRGRRGVSDVEYDVRLRMVDKIRPVNLDDEYGGGDGSGTDWTGGSGGGGGGGGGGDAGGGGGSGGGGTDPGSYTLDDFTRDDTLRSVSSAADSGSGTSFSLALPDGLDVAGRLLVFFVAWDNRSNVDPSTALTSAGLTELIAGVPFFMSGGNGDEAYSIFMHEVTGTEGWTGTGDTIDFTLADTANVVVVSELLSGVYSTISWQFDSTNGAGDPDPDQLDPPVAWEGDIHRWYTYLVTDGSAITGRPTGYDNVGEDAVGDIRVSLDAKSEVHTGTPQDPSTYTSSGAINAAHIVVRGGGALEGWGVTPDGGDAPWEGGNTWDVSASDADVYVEDGVGYVDITADGGSATMTLVSDSPDAPSDEPWGPWVDGAEFLVKFKVNPLGDTADTDPNFLQMSVFDGSSRARVRVHLGDNVNWVYQDPDQQRGIVLTTGATTYSDFVPKSLVADTWYFLRWDIRTTVMRAKLWRASEQEPVAWDVTLSKDDESGLDDSAEMTLSVYGNDGMLFGFDTIDASLTAGSGLLPPGDGATVTWYIAPWRPGTLRVYVDGVQVAPVSIDRDAGTFTFDRAPDVGAVIRAEYDPA